VLEYNLLTYEHAQISTIGGADLDAFYARVDKRQEEQNSHVNVEQKGEEEGKEQDREATTFDFVFSMSSLDHDGLGRYGDPISPSGDLFSMRRLQAMLATDKGADNGLLFLTVPIGSDVRVWNLHSRYGPLRLPLLFEGWEIVDRIGWKGEEMLVTEANWRQTYEPVIVLRKQQQQQQQQGFVATGEL